MIEITTGLLVILFFVAMTAGFFDAISGGGGLLTVPALLMAGVPPLMALGTNKFQGVFGTATATMTFATKGHLDLRPLRSDVLWPLLWERLRHRLSHRMHWRMCCLLC